MDTGQCTVCGEKSTRYIFYGGKSCASCRQFFRRSVVRFGREASTSYPCICDEECLKNNLVLCNIDKNTRTNCKHCRYTKCVLSAGMRPQWVLQQYIPKVENKKENAASKKSKNRKSDLNCHSGSSENVRSSALALRNRESTTISKCGSIPFEANTFPVQEEKFTRLLSLPSNDLFSFPGNEVNIIINEFVTTHNNHIKSICFGEQLLTQAIFASFYKTPLSLECHVATYRIALKRITNAAKNFPGFSHLHSNLQAHLLKNNVNMIFALGAASLDALESFEDKITRELGIGDYDIAMSIIANVTTSPSCDKLGKCFMGSEMRNARFSFENTCAEERHQLLESRVKTKVGFDYSLVVLISYVLLFSGDHLWEEKVSLMERRKIEKTQETMVSMVQMYLYAKHPKDVATVIFRKSMESLIELREVCDIMNKLQIQ